MALGVRTVGAAEMGPVAVELVRGWAEQGVAFGDMAVLTRVNSSLLAVQLLLAQAKIPYRAAVGPCPAALVQIMIEARASIRAGRDVAARPDFL